jgi:20S proteasome subunit beta 6
VLSLVIDSFTGATERHIEVGDGLEIYIVLAADRPSADLKALPDVKRLPGTFSVMGEAAGAGSDGEKMFVLRRELKKD